MNRLNFNKLSFIKVLNNNSHYKNNCLIKNNSLNNSNNNSHNINFKKSFISITTIMNNNNNNNNNNKDSEGICNFSTTSINNNNNNSSSSEDLSKKKCVPCEGNIPPLDEKSKNTYLNKVHKDWKLSEDNKKIIRNWRIPFPKSVEYLNSISNIAEEEGHHPDISIESYWNFKITIYTHSIYDLTENDFILASKIDLLNIESFKPKNKTKNNNNQ